jgi:ABC-type lipoprotein release transport system permease subunit
MGRVLLVGRLALRDLWRRPVEAALLLLALMASTTTLTLGLVLHDAASDPYRSTREVTDGPDVVAFVGPGPDSDQPVETSGLDALADASGVVDHSGPYPVTTAELEASGRTSDIQAMGRDTAPSAVDQPRLVQGEWVSDGGVVVEAAFAGALDLQVGDTVTIQGRSFDVVGIAVTAAMPPYPESTCYSACFVGTVDDEVAAELGPEAVLNPGLVWLTQETVPSLASDPELMSWVMNLKLADPAEAQGFIDSQPFTGMDDPGLLSWQDILEEATQFARDVQIVLVAGSLLLSLLAVASVAVLVGGRMADQTRRVGLLKAAGGTPRLVAAVLLAEYVLVAVVAAAAGLAVGALTAPLLTQSTAGLLGSAGTPSITLPTVAVVTAVALGVAAIATFVPAVRAARISTVRVLADAARPPHRTGWLITLSARLPAPLLLAVRAAARRPRRLVLGVASIAITVSGIVVALAANAELAAERLAGGYDALRAEPLGRVLGVIVAVLLCLAAVNAVFLTWSTVLDNRKASALARALGATPGDVSTSLAAAQVLPALAGALLGVFPGSIALFAVINAINDGSNQATPPPLWQLVAVVAGTVLVVALLTAVPARLGGRRPVTPSLQAEHA